MLTMLNKSIPLARMVLGLLSASLLLASLAFGQDTVAATPASHQFTVNYFTNNAAGDGNPAGIPEAQLHITNPGTTGAFGNPNEASSTPVLGGDLCANIYVFDYREELLTCCSCKISPNGMRGLALSVDLVNDGISVTGASPSGGNVKIVSSFGAGAPAGLPSPGPVFGQDGGACDSSASGGLVAAATTYTPFGQLEAWITHVRPLTSGVAPWSVTETSFSSVTLSTSELQKLQQRCFAATAPASSGGLGSGRGRCGCGTLF